jgi:hypothetical protein
VVKKKKKQAPTSWYGVGNVWLALVPIIITMEGKKKRLFSDDVKSFLNFKMLMVSLTNPFLSSNSTAPMIMKKKKKKKKTMFWFIFKMCWFDGIGTNHHPRWAAAKISH